MWGLLSTPDLAHPPGDVVKLAIRGGWPHGEGCRGECAHGSALSLLLTLECESPGLGRNSPALIQAGHTDCGAGGPPGLWMVCSLLYPEDQPGSWQEHSHPRSAFSEYK